MAANSHTGGPDLECPRAADSLTSTVSLARAPTAPMLGAEVGHSIAIPHKIVPDIHSVGTRHMIEEKVRGRAEHPGL